MGSRTGVSTNGVSTNALSFNYAFIIQLWVSSYAIIIQCSEWGQHYWGHCNLRMFWQRDLFGVVCFDRGSALMGSYVLTEHCNLRMVLTDGPFRVLLLTYFFTFPKVPGFTVPPICQTPLLFASGPRSADPIILYVMLYDAIVTNTTTIIGDHTDPPHPHPKHLLSMALNLIYTITHI